MNEVRAEVDYDRQHGPIVRVTVGDTAVAVFLYDETGIVSTPRGQAGLEVSGPWHKLKQTLTPEKAEQEYSETELNCKACFGPCGRCEEIAEQVGRAYSESKEGGLWNVYRADGGFVCQVGSIAEADAVLAALNIRPPEAQAVAYVMSFDGEPRIAILRASALEAGTKLYLHPPTDEAVRLLKAHLESLLEPARWLFNDSCMMYEYDDPDWCRSIERHEKVRDFKDSMDAAIKFLSNQQKGDE